MEEQLKGWWTGEDSNLRSPQGAADLQSAAINHSATRPQTANHGVPFSRREPCTYSELPPRSFGIQTFLSDSINLCSPSFRRAVSADAEFPILPNGNVGA